MGKYRPEKTPYLDTFHAASFVKTAWVAIVVVKSMRNANSKNEKDGQAVRDLIQNMDDFDADPFDKCAPELHSLQYGVIASSEVLE